MKEVKVKRLSIVPKYNQQAVTILEELLELARAGTLVEIVNTAKYNDGTFGHCWSGCDNFMELVGVLERQKLAVLRRMDA